MKNRASGGPRYDQSSTWRRFCFGYFLTAYKVKPNKINWLFITTCAGLPNASSTPVERLSGDQPAFRRANSSALISCTLAQALEDARVGFRHPRKPGLVAPVRRGGHPRVVLFPLVEQVTAFRSIQPAEGDEHRHEQTRFTRPLRGDLDVLLVQRSLNDRRTTVRRRVAPTNRARVEPTSGSRRCAAVEPSLERTPLTTFAPPRLPSGRFWAAQVQSASSERMP